MSELILRKIDLLPEDHPILHQEPLTWVFDPPQADPKLMYDIMLENMVYHHGLGLSANQIGMPVKVFAMRIDESDNAIVCFNPEIQEESKNQKAKIFQIRFLKSLKNGQKMHMLIKNNMKKNIIYQLKIMKVFGEKKVKE